MKFNRHNDIAEASFDLTAMIDVVLLLIIFFMLSSQFAKVQLKPMPLPNEPGQKSPVSMGSHALVVDVAVDGTLNLLNVGEVNIDQLLAQIQQHTQTLTGEKTEDSLDLTIRVDRNCPALHLNRLAGSLAKVGVRNWKLATSGSEGGV